MNARLNRLITLSLLVIAISAPAFASSDTAYYCLAKSETTKKTYISELVEGELQLIAATVEFGDFLEKNHAVSSVGTTCTAYGSKAKPVNMTTAKKLWDLKIQQEGILSKVVVVQWLPG